MFSLVMKLYSSVFPQFYSVFLCKIRFVKILIIEDEVELVKSLTVYLRDENYVCEVAGNYREALKKIDLHDYDCILLDISLPDGSGLNILKELKANNKLDGVL